MYDHQYKTCKLSNLPLFGVATRSVFMLSAMFARKIHCIRSGSYSVLNSLTIHVIVEFYRYKGAQRRRVFVVICFVFLKSFFFSLL